MELKHLLRVGLLITSNRVLWYSTPIIVSVLTFLTFTKIAGNELTASIAFTSLALFNMLRMPLQLFPNTIVQLLDTWVSYTRIRSFLSEPELEDRSVNSSIHVGFSNASFSWDHHQESSNQGMLVSILT